MEPKLVGTTRDRRSVDMTPVGFGLQPHQFHQWIAKQLGAPASRAAQGQETLARLAQIWNRDHGGADQVVAVELQLEHTALPVGRGTSVERLLTWRAP